MQANTHRHTHIDRGMNCRCCQVPPQHTATHCNTMQHTVTHCNKLQHTTQGLHVTTELQYTHTHTRTHTHRQGHELQVLLGAERLISHYGVDVIFLEFAPKVSTACSPTQCNTLQHTAPLHHCSMAPLHHCNILQLTATHYNTLQHTATYPPRIRAQGLYRSATHCNTLKPTTTHCNTLHHCNTLQHNATYCNTLQHICAWTTELS